MDAFFAAIEARDIDTVRSYLERDPSLANSIDSRQTGSQKARTDTALHVAAQYQQLEIVRLLVKHGAEVNAVNRGLSTPLHRVMWNQHQRIELVEFLVEHRANVNAKDGIGNNILNWAFRWDQDAMPILDLLLRNGADVNQAGHQGTMPLDKAVMMLGSPWNHVPRFELLLRYGVNVNPIRNDEHIHRPPLSGVAANGNAAVTRMLIEAGADVNARDRRGTALHQAARNGHDQIVALLLAAGADPRAANGEGFHPLGLTKPFEETLDHFKRLLGERR